MQTFAAGPPFQSVLVRTRNTLTVSGFAKGHVLRCKTWPFSARLTAFWKAKDSLLGFNRIASTVWSNDTYIQKGAPPTGARLGIDLQNALMLILQE